MAGFPDLALAPYAIISTTQDTGEVWMTGQDEQERRDRWRALGIRTDVAHPARAPWTTPAQRLRLAGRGKGRTRPADEGSFRQR